MKRKTQTANHLSCMTQMIVKHEISQTDGSVQNVKSYSFDSQLRHMCLHVVVCVFDPIFILFFFESTLKYVCVCVCVCVCV